MCGRNWRAGQAPAALAEPVGDLGREALAVLPRPGEFGDTQRLAYLTPSHTRLAGPLDVHAHTGPVSSVNEAPGHGGR
jgi:hypothetical protein